MRNLLRSVTLNHAVPFPLKIYVSNIRSQIFLVNSYNQSFFKKLESSLSLHGPFKVKVFKFLKEKYKSLVTTLSVKRLFRLNFLVRGTRSVLGDFKLSMLCSIYS